MTDPEDPGDDVALLLRLSLGDKAALAEAFDRFAPTLTRYAWAIAPSRMDVEELVQDTLLTLWQKAPGLELSTRSLLPWLLVTCRNHARNLLRRQARTQAHELPEDLAAPMDAAEDRERLRWVRDRIEALPALDRTICELCLLEGYSYSEAADKVGLTVGAVTKRVSRSRARLRKAVTNDEL